MLDVRESGIAIAYIVAAVLFILGLKQLSSPATARSGNRLAAIGMALALAATLLDRQIISFWIIAAGTIVGAAIGLPAAALTAHPIQSWRFGVQPIDAVTFAGVTVVLIASAAASWIPAQRATRSEPTAALKAE